MKINKENNTILLNYDEVIKEITGFDIEEDLQKFAYEDAQYFYQDPYDEYELCEYVEHLLLKDYKTESSWDIQLNGAYFDNYSGSYRCWLVYKEQITINGYTESSWLFDLEVEIDDLKEYIEFISDKNNKDDWEEEHIADRERIDDLKRELKQLENKYNEIENVFSDTYDYLVERVNWLYDLERLEEEALERVRESNYIINIEELTLESDYSCFGANLEYEDLSDNLKDLIDIKEREIIKTVKYYELKNK